MNENIVHEIKSGEYFKESYRWYFAKYVDDDIHQSWLMVSCIVMWLLAILCFFLSYSLIKSDNNVNYMLPANYDIFNKDIKNIQCGDYGIKKSLTEILIHNYIIQREKYNSKNLITQYNYIKNSSNELVFSKFKEYMNLLNPISPIKLYNNNIRQINIKKSHIDYDNNTAVIIFNSKAFDNTGSIFEDTDWQANVKFLSNINNIESTNYLINIVGYELKVISDNL